MITKKQIIDFLRDESDRPVMDIDLQHHFRIEGSDTGPFYALLDDMERQGDIIRTKKKKVAVPERFGLVVGKLQITQKGFGFILSEHGKGDDVFVPASELKGAMNNDRVMAKITSGAGGGKRREGAIERIIERANQKIVGTFEKVKDYGFVIADDKRIRKDVYIPFDGVNGAETGLKVVATINEWPEGGRNPEGYISEILGHKDDPGTDILAIIRKFQLPEVFPKKVIREASAVEPEVHPQELKQRKDIRHLNIVTIDGPDAKDLDDAVSVEQLENGWFRLGVHIADVTHYVKEGSKLDQEAIKRATSVYLVDRVIPMLPPELSNGICSLNPKIDRLTLSVFMEIDRTGKVQRHEVAETVIKTKERMVYGDVSDILEGNERPELEKYGYLKEDFKRFEELAMILRKRREQRGSIDFDFPEPYIKLDENGTPIEIVERERRIANRIIEEFMLVTNETVAEYFYWMDIPFVYRIHEEPDMERIESFKKFIHNFGFHLKGLNEVHPKAMQQLLHEIKGSPEEHIINKLMLRSLKQAKYSPDCEGHFGLAAKYYCHFTSPIRRYPDLQIHRIIKEMLHKELTPARLEQLEGIVLNASEVSSERERVAEEAERETDDLKKAEYMSQFIGEEFEGIISSVTSFGMFIELPNTIEGLVRVSDMEDDYYVYDEANMMYVGERHKQIYRIGDRVKIVVLNVNIAYREIDFFIIGKLEN